VSERAHQYALANDHGTPLLRPVGHGWWMLENDLNLIHHPALPPILTQAPAGIVLLGGKLEMAVIYLHTRGEPLHELAWMGRPDAYPA
jgi:hypothetical protein